MQGFNFDDDNFQITWDRIDEITGMTWKRTTGMPWSMWREYPTAAGLAMALLVIHKENSRANIMQYEQ